MFFVRCLAAPNLARALDRAAAAFHWRILFGWRRRWPRRRSNGVGFANAWWQQHGMGVKTGVSTDELGSHVIADAPDQSICAILGGPVA
jgi:hypothetical protein